MAKADMLRVGRWSLQCQFGWDAELEDGCVCLTKRDGVGALLISHAAKHRTPITRAELQQLAATELPSTADAGPCTMGAFQGLHATYVTDDARWHRFYLSYGTVLLLVTYTVELAHDGVEDDEVITMLRSLQAQGDPWE